MLSAVRRGARYELMITRRCLPKYDFNVTRCGKVNDRGVDFRGSWTLLGLDSIPVLGQCKCFQRPIGPVIIREFAAVVKREQRHANDVPYLGVICAAGGFTELARREWRDQDTPLVLMRWPAPSFIPTQTKSPLNLDAMQDDLSWVDSIEATPCLELQWNPAASHHFHILNQIAVTWSWKSVYNDNNMSGNSIQKSSPILRRIHSDDTIPYA